MYKNDNPDYYFTRTGFFDLLPAATRIARELHCTRNEMIEAICKVADKAQVYPPVKNRAAWFATVFREKLLEARAEILALKNRYRY